MPGFAMAEIRQTLMYSTMKTYTYQEQYPDCYSLHRPDGTDFCFLQGDDARDFERVVIEEIEGKHYAWGTFNSTEELVSAYIHQYDC